MQNDHVIEHEGLRWRRRPGAFTTAVDFLAARSRFLSIHDEIAWSPWLEEARADELQQVMTTMRTWTRAEPGFRPMTREELDAEWAREDAEHALQLAEQDALRAERRKQYDATRESTRLRLLEQEAYLQMQERERHGLEQGTRFPSMPPDNRVKSISECDRYIAALRPAVDRLRLEVGDPETVVDQQGATPSERREVALAMFAAERRAAVRQLEPEVQALEQALATTRGQKAQREATELLAKQQSLLDAWKAVPPLQPDEMCSECPRPAEWHLTGRVTPIGWEAPCPAWPLWHDRLERAWDLLQNAPRADQAERPAPRPAPLAVIPSGLSVEEVITRLSELQAEHPGAEVHRGRGNRWELWPRADSGPSA